MDNKLINLLDPNIDTSKLSEEEFKNSYHAMMRQFDKENDEASMVQLNAIQDEYKRSKIADKKNENISQFSENLENEDIYLYDDKKNIIKENGIPRPRYRKADESIKEYEEFLSDFYEKIFPRLQERKQTDIKTGNYGKNNKLGISGPVIGEENNLGIPGPVLGEENNLGISGTVLGEENNLGISGPVLGEENNLGIPGPVLGEDNTHRIPGPVIGDDNRLGLPGPTKNPNEKNYRTLEEILQEINEGLEVKASDNRKYKASQIKVARQFKEELSSGEFLYNISRLVPALISIPVSVVRKLLSIPKSKETKERLQALQERISNLSNEDMEVVRRELVLGKANEKGLQGAVLTMLNERVQAMANEEVSNINSQISNDFREAFEAFGVIGVINERLRDENTTKEEKEKLEKVKQKYYNGKAELIERIRNNQQKGAEILSGGAEGFSQDIKAAQTKMNLVGKIRAKRLVWDDELGAQEAEYSKKEKEAIQKGNDEDALNTFIAWEQLKSQSTNIEQGLFGKYSKGSRYYTPLINRLDYRDDPLVKDVLTTVAVVSAAIGTYNAVKTHKYDDQQLLDQEQKRATSVNEQNEAVMEQVHQTGKKITGKRKDFNEGMQANAYSDTSHFGNLRERVDLNNHKWGIGDPNYEQADALSHDATHQLFDSTKQQFEDIAARQATKEITAQQAIKEIANVSSKNNQILQEQLKNALPNFESYAQNHPLLNMEGYNRAVENIISNPEAIIKMNEGMVEVTKLGKSLKGLSPIEMEVLKSIPNDMYTTLASTASAALLATKVSQTTQTNYKQGKYGNELTKMVEESYQNQAATTQAKSK